MRFSCQSLSVKLGNFFSNSFTLKFNLFVWLNMLSYFTTNGVFSPIGSNFVFFFLPYLLSRLLDFVQKVTNFEFPYWIFDRIPLFCEFFVNNRKRWIIFFTSERIIFKKLIRKDWKFVIFCLKQPLKFCWIIVALRK